MLAEALRQMQADVVRRASAFSTSAFGSSSGRRQYREISHCQLVWQMLGRPAGALPFQSRNGPPEPDIRDHIRQLHSAGLGDLVVMPIGFVSEHMELIYGLDKEAAALCRQLGVNLTRAVTAGTHPAFVPTIGELILERNSGQQQRAPGTLGCVGLFASGEGRPQYLTS